MINSDGIPELSLLPPLSLTQQLRSQSATPQNPVPLPGTDAIKSRPNTGDCNAYIASLIAKANELYGGNGNVAVAKDGLDLLSKISAQGGFVTKDFLYLARLRLRQPPY